MINKFLLLTFSFLTAGILAAPGQETTWEGPSPEASSYLKSISSKFNSYTTALKPDKDAAEYWAGAPSVVKDEEGNIVLEFEI